MGTAIRSVRTALTATMTLETEFGIMIVGAASGPVSAEAALLHHEDRAVIDKETADMKVIKWK